MSLQNWVVQQSPAIKLLLGLGSGVFIYVLLRGLVYYANKDYKKALQGKKNKQLPIWEQG